MYLVPGWWWVGRGLWLENDKGDENQNMWIFCSGPDPLDKGNREMSGIVSQKMLAFHWVVWIWWFDNIYLVRYCLFFFNNHILSQLGPLIFQFWMFELLLHEAKPKSWICILWNVTSWVWNSETSGFWFAPRIFAGERCWGHSCTCDAEAGRPAVECTWLGGGVEMAPHWRYVQWISRGLARFGPMACLVGMADFANIAIHIMSSLSWCKVIRYHVFAVLPAVPHEAVVEVSEIGNYRKGWLVG